VVPERPQTPQRPVEKAWFIPEGARWTGEMLRRARESRSMTVAQLAERTKITRHHIENVEGDRFKSLPAAVYLRGIVMSMARELRLDGQKVARSYLEHMAEASKGPGEPRV
jgi:cytoskeletal protein RodZ